MQNEELNQKFNDFLKKFDGESCEKASEESVDRLSELFGGKMPELLLNMYKEHVLNDEIECGEIVLYGIDRIVEENNDYVPGANVHPLGLYTFASELDGDAICFDINAPAFPVYQCSHSLLEDEEEIYFSKDDEMKSLPFTYENVTRISHRLADSFEEFVEKLIDYDIELYGVLDMIREFE